MAFSTAHREPTHRSPSLSAWHLTLLSLLHHHRYHHAQQHRTSLMRTAAAATAAAVVCYPEIDPAKPYTLRDLLLGGSEGPHQPHVVAVTACLFVAAGLVANHESITLHTLALGTSMVMVLQRLQRATPFHHLSAQRPCAVGQRAPSW